MVYEYSTRRIYSTSSPRPVISSSYTYSVPSTRTYSYTVSDPEPIRTENRVQKVTTVKTVKSSDSSLPGGSRTYTTTTETRDYGTGPRTQSYTSETSTGPGGASYFSTASYKSPYIGNSFRHMSYK